MNIRDYQSLGALPLQDHDPQTYPEIRQQVVGVRVARLDGEGSGDGLIEVGQVNFKGTFGDLHPFGFWQTADRTARGMGSWSPAFAAVLADDGYGGRYAQKIQPIYGDEYRNDTRYDAKTFAWPECFGTLPRGTMLIHMYGSREDRQDDLVMHADPRLVAPAHSGQADMGTLVVDLQPEGILCMEGNSRAARIQSMMRVVAIKDRNAVAWNLAEAEQGSMHGNGICWGKLDTLGTGPTTPGGGSGGGTGRGPTTPQSILGGGQHGPPGRQGTHGTTACDRGEFEARRKPGYGSALMSFEGGRGPLVIGHENDKHQLGKDLDGNPINSGHISEKANYYRNSFFDGPLFFESLFPRVSSYPLSSHVHLSFDPLLDYNGHPGTWRWWAEVPYIAPPRTPGDKDPPEIPPPEIPPRGPRTPGGGTPPGPGTPSTPGSGGGKPGTPTGPTTPRGGDPRLPLPFSSPAAAGAGYLTGEGLPGWPIPGHPGGELPPPDWFRELEVQAQGGGGQSGPTTPGGGSTPLQDETSHVGTNSQGDRQLYSIFHPMQEGFGAIGFRPQFWENGYGHFEHGASLPAELIRADELFRPQVLTMRAWGAQAGSEWDYTARPWESRARGGLASGGVLLSPAEFEMEDYFGLGEAMDVESPRTTSYFTAAHGVGFALGTPSTDGGLAPKSIIIRQDPADITNYQLKISQIIANGTDTPILTATATQAGGAVSVDVKGDLNIDGDLIPNAYKTTGGDTGMTQVVSIVGDSFTHELTFVDGLLTAYSTT